MKGLRLKYPAAMVARFGTTWRSPSLLPLFGDGRVIAAVLTIGLAGCSPMHVGMMGAMGAGAMMGMKNTTPSSPQSCQVLATAVHAEARQLLPLAADSVRALLPTHRRSVEVMLARCAADSTGGSHEATTAEHTVVAGEIRTDLTRMEQMSADSLRVFLPEHAARLERFAMLSSATSPRAIQERRDH